MDLQEFDELMRKTALGAGLVPGTVLGRETDQHFRRERSAHHESGHAIVAVAHGLDPVRASIQGAQLINRTGDNVKITFATGHVTCIMPKLESIDVTLFQSSAANQCAGHLGALLYTEQLDLRGFRNDLGLLNAYAQRLVDLQSYASLNDAIRAAARFAAETLLKYRDGHAWLVEQLLTHGTVERQIIAEALEMRS